MKDFTLEKYKELIESIQQGRYKFQSFGDFIEKPEKKQFYFAMM